MCSRTRPMTRLSLYLGLLAACVASWAAIVALLIWLLAGGR